MARKTKTINVGLIGCNKRALWYGAIFGNVDPLVLDIGQLAHAGLAVRVRDPVAGHRPLSRQITTSCHGAYLDSL